jgi:hypothetical protein
MLSHAKPPAGVPQKLEAEAERKQAKKEAALAAGTAGVVDGAGEKSNSHSRKGGYHGKLGAHFGHRGQRDAQTKTKLLPSSGSTRSMLPKNFPASLQKKLPKQPAYDAKISLGASKVAKAQAKVCNSARTLSSIPSSISFATDSGFGLLQSSCAVVEDLTPSGRWWNLAAGRAAEPHQQQPHRQPVVRAPAGSRPKQLLSGLFRVPLLHRNT